MKTKLIILFLLLPVFVFCQSWEMYPGTGNIVSTITFNASYSGGLTLSNGNLTAVRSAAGFGMAIGTVAASGTDKKYFEVLCTSSGSFWGIGISRGNASVYLGGDNNSFDVLFHPSTNPQTQWNGGNYQSYSTGFVSAGTVIGCGIDIAANTITYYKAGVSMGARTIPNSGIGVNTLGAPPYYPAVGNLSTVMNVTANFGASPYTASPQAPLPPTGYTNF
jgi:hypothetical protein